MSDILKRIKRAVLAGDCAFSMKARLEMEVDEITGTGTWQEFNS